MLFKVFVINNWKGDLSQCGEMLCSQHVALLLLCSSSATFRVRSSENIHDNWVFCCFSYVWRYSTCVNIFLAETVAARERIELGTRKSERLTSTVSTEVQHMRFGSTLHWTRVESSRLLLDNANKAIYIALHWRFGPTRASQPDRLIEI